jgi:cytochrome c biogenesis protein
MTTKDAGLTLPRLGPWGTARFIWRQLTSMRTALFLLLLLAVAAVPGSVLPQYGIDASKVATYRQDHTTLGPLLDRIGAFSVFSSVWFSAIYLLLFISLVGCLVPRTWQQLAALRQPPPRTPTRPERLPVSTEFEVRGAQDGDPATQANEVAELLRRRHFRVAVQEEGRAVSAERGRLREFGNLGFHLSLVGLLLSVAAGHLWGWRGDVIVPVGSTTVDAVGAYNTLDLGPWVDAEDLPPFSLHVDSMTVKFQTTGGEVGAPSEFKARVDVQKGDGPTEQQLLSVNHPLNISGARVFLLGNGYAPLITVRDSTGKVVYSQATPFLPQDGNYRSLGVVKATAARPEPLGLTGFFLPTAGLDKDGNATSLFPDLGNPRLILSAYEGDPQLERTPSIYLLDTSKMTPLVTESGGPVLALSPGQTATLKGGKGTVTFDGVVRYAGLSVRHDPGKTGALVFALLAILGLVLSLSVRRRRIFVRLDPAPGRTVVRVAGLARGEDSGLADEVEAVRAAVAERLDGRVGAVAVPDGVKGQA